MLSDDWNTIADSSPENRRLAEVLRLVEGVYDSCSPVNWTRSRLRCAKIFHTFYETDPASKALTSQVLDTEYAVGGDEHHLIRLPDKSDRIFKLTYGDAFGCFSRFSPSDPELTGKHFHGSINDDPAFYLRRWMLLNYISGYHTRFEGLVPPLDPLRLHRICISQPVLEGPNPTETQIESALRGYGYQKISTDAFLSLSTGILLTDAAPRNVRIVENIPVLFDAICTIATNPVREWALSRRQPDDGNGLLPKNHAAAPASSQDQ